VTTPSLSHLAKEYMPLIGGIVRRGRLILCIKESSLEVASYARKAHLANRAVTVLLCHFSLSHASHHRHEKSHPHSL